MHGIDYAALRAQVNIAEVLLLTNFQAAELSGAQFRGYCPIHDFADQPLIIGESLGAHAV